MHGAAIMANGPETSRLIVERNVIYRSRGGIFVAWGGNEQPTGYASSNILVEIGIAGGPPDPPVSVGTAFETRNNTCFDNKDDSTKGTSREMFWRARRPWTRTYRNTPVGVDGRHKFYESAFLTRYGRWAD
jgi:hypothetical protein